MYICRSGEHWCASPGELPICVVLACQSLLKDKRIKYTHVNVTLQGVSAQVEARMQRAASGQTRGERPMLLFPEARPAWHCLSVCLLLWLRLVILATAAGHNNQRALPASLQARQAARLSFGRGRRTQVPKLSG